MNEGYISHVEQANNLTIALHHSSAASKEHVNNMHYLDGWMELYCVDGSHFWYFKLICEHCKFEQDEQNIL